MATLLICLMLFMIVLAILFPRAMRAIILWSMIAVGAFILFGHHGLGVL